MNIVFDAEWIDSFHFPVRKVDDMSNKSKAQLAVERAQAELEKAQAALAKENEVVPKIGNIIKDPSGGEYEMIKTGAAPKLLFKRCSDSVAWSTEVMGGPSHYELDGKRCTAWPEV